MPIPPLDTLKDVALFQELTPGDLAELSAAMSRVTIPRGAALVRQGDPADTLYIVLSGRFAVYRAGTDVPIALIGAGEPVGEIAFLSGGERTATVLAERDSVVGVLSREAFDAICARLPTLTSGLTRVLARRLAATTAGRARPRQSPPRTIAVARAGQHGALPAFVDMLRTAAAADPRLVIVDHDAAARAVASDGTFDSCEETQAFNDMEAAGRTLLFVCDAEPGPWTDKALRQADVVLLVADASLSAAADRVVAPCERLAASLHRPENIRVVMFHPPGRHLPGAAKWLDSRDFSGAHHHVAERNEADLARLFRFLLGGATGLVASGGGAFAAAHIGMYEACLAAGHDFDIMGGTSGGAAMTAAFALGVPPDEISRRTHDMFVRRKAMARWTWPRYSLLDHTVFDETLAEHFTDIDIADLKRPFFAVATNLTRNELSIIRRGPLWLAVRASAAIPALFPPIYAANGDMLVDGGLLDNVPVRPMRSLKEGPNVVLDLDVPALGIGAEGATLTLPSRVGLIRHVLTGTAQSGLPDAPGPQAVLVRALMRDNRDIAGLIEPGDIALRFPVPAGASVLDWSRHRDLRNEARAFAAARLAGGTVGVSPAVAGAATVGHATPSADVTATE